MFVIRSDLRALKVVKEQIVAIIESINTPMVAAAERTTQQAKVFIVGVRNPSGLFTIFIYLHLLDSKECLIYTCDPPEIPMTSYHSTELEALQFVESMGFMVDNLHFRNLPPDQQEQMLGQLPITHEDLQSLARHGDGSEPSSGGEGEDKEGVDLTPLQGDVIELEDDAVIEEPTKPSAPMVPAEGLAKIARLLGSF